jgi:cytochrome P450
VSLFAQVIATHGPSLTPAALDAMSYMDAVIREVLRITPPSASVFRKALVDLEVRDMTHMAGHFE